METRVVGVGMMCGGHAVMNWWRTCEHDVAAATMVITIDHSELSGTHVDAAAGDDRNEVDEAADDAGEDDVQTVRIAVVIIMIWM
eukprot:2699773-Pyramimonas_sp.AAC.1